MSYSNPIDLHRVAMDHPSTNFVLPHFGAGYFREALMLASLAPNVYLDTSSSNSWTKYLTPQPSLQDVFAQALDVVGPKRLLFGSDSSFFPRGWNCTVFDAQCEALAQAGASQSDAEAIFGANLARLLSPRVLPLGTRKSLPSDPADIPAFTSRWDTQPRPVGTMEASYVKSRS